MPKRVKVAVELSESFIRMLNATVALRGMRDKDNTAVGVLAIALLAEARGGLEEEVNAEIPQKWRPDILVLHDFREVTEEEAPEPDDLGMVEPESDVEVVETDLF